LDADGHADVPTVRSNHDDAPEDDAAYLPIVQEKDDQVYRVAWFAETWGRLLRRRRVSGALLAEALAVDMLVPVRRGGKRG
jgi:hypothetical protein